MVQNGQTIDVADALVVTKQIVAGFEQSKAKDLVYYNKCSDEIKPLMNGLSFDDIVSVLKNDWIPQYEAMLAGDAPEDEADYEGDVEEDSDKEEE